MTLTINGEPRNSTAKTLTALVAELGMRPDRVAIELNREIVPRDRWLQTELKRGRPTRNRALCRRREGMTKSRAATESCRSQHDHLPFDCPGACEIRQLDEKSVSDFLPFCYNQHPRLISNFLLQDHAGR